MSGTSNFPQAVDNYTPLVDGVDVIQADDENNSYVAHNKTQTFIGSSGAPQSHNTDLLAQIFGAKEVLGTIQLSYVDQGTIRASAGIVVCENGTGTLRKLRKNTSTVNITFADLDTGSEQASTRYYVYAVADATATTVTFKISTNPTTPSGVTSYKRIGHFFNDASSNIVQKSVTSEISWKLAQIVEKRYSDAITISYAEIPSDDTIPQSTEGALAMTVEITPKKPTNVLVVEHGYWTSTTPMSGMIVCIFKDSEANAAAVWNEIQAASHSYGSYKQSFYYGAAGGVNEISFKLRIGSGGFTINGAGGSRRFGGAGYSFMRVKEYEPS